MAPEICFVMNTSTFNFTLKTKKHHELIRLGEITVDEYEGGGMKNIGGLSVDKPPHYLRLCLKSVCRTDFLYTILEIIYSKNP